MEKLRSEVYIEDGESGTSLVDIYSHVKNAWVYHSPVPNDDILSLLSDLVIKPDSTIIHMSSKSPAFNDIRKAKFQTKLFVGLSGKYDTIDDSVYQLHYEPSPKPPKKDRVLIAEHITPTEHKPANRFAVKEEHIERNIRFGTWKKKSA